MVIHSRDDKKLVVPSALGNFGGSSSTGGSGMTPEEVQGMIDTSIEEYDTEIQVDLEDLSDRISGNTEDIAELSGATVALKEQVDGISLSGITADIEALSVQTSANTQNIGVLSGATTALTSSVDNLAGAVTALTEGVESLSGQTTANTQNIEAVSGAVETLSASLSGYTTTDTFNSGISGVQGQISGVSEGVAELSAFTSGLSFTVSEQAQNLEQLSGATEALEQAMSGKQGTLTAGNGIEISGATISVKAGEGLGFSGDTLVVSGGTSSGPQVVYLNKLTEQERLALYSTITSYYDYNANGFTSAWTEDLYAFYIDLRDYNDQQSYSVADRYEGLFPMQVVRCHPTDYGGAVFFTGVEGDRDGNGHLINIRFVITVEGGVDAGTWWNSPAVAPPSIGTVTFGNDEGTGMIGYDADNDRFYKSVDSSTFATGDTTSYVDDLVDWNYLNALFNRNGRFNDGYVINIHSFEVSRNGETTTYSCPTLSRKAITGYTIGDYTFQYEVSFKYTDWVLKIDMSEGHNVGANLRISAV